MAEFRKTLCYRLGRGLLLLLVLLSVLQLVVFVLSFRYFSDQRDQTSNWALAERLVPHIQPALAAEASYVDLLKVVKTITDSNADIDLHILDDAGTVVGPLNVLGGSDGNPVVDVTPIQEFLKGVGNASYPIYGNDPQGGNRRDIFSAARMTIAGKPHYLYVCLHNNRSRALYNILGENTLGLLSVIFLLLSSVGAAFVGIVILYFVTRRFRILTQSVQKFRAHDFSARVAVESEDEVGDLALAFNQMAETIEGSFAELEHRDETRRDLIAAVSHDLRGPVAILSGYAQKLQEVATQRSPELLNEIGVTVHRSAASLTQLLHELFELAKLEAKEKRIECHPMMIEEVVGPLVEDFQERAKDLAITLSFFCDSNLPAVSGDSALLERAIHNLIDNALRYTPENGRVEVRITHRDAGLVVAVSDTGIGIAEADLPQIFEKFHRIQSAKPRVGESSGLGLAIVKRIIEAHGTSILVQSELGKGTSFSFFLAGLPKIES